MSDKVNTFGATALLYVFFFSVTFPAVAMDTSALTSLYGLSVPELDTILSSESAADFGNPLSDDDSAALFSKATEWQWDSTMASEEDSARFHPFLVCDSTPDLSGNRRRQKLQGLVPRIAFGDTVLNSEDESCFQVSSAVDELRGALEALPESDEYMKIQPMLPSMKMVKGTKDDVQWWLDNGKSGVEPPVVESSASAVAVMATEAEDDPVLKLSITLCPASTEADLQSVAQDMVSFLTDNEGNLVIQNSFFYRTPSDHEKVSERMTFWSGMMKNATTSDCFSAIKEEMLIERSLSDSVSVMINARDIGPGQDSCIWYAVRGLAQHRYVCRMEADVRGVSVFEKPYEPVTEPTPLDWDHPSMDAASSATAWRFSLPGIGALVMLLAFLVV